MRRAAPWGGLGGTQNATAPGSQAGQCALTSASLGLSEAVPSHLLSCEGALELLLEVAWGQQETLGQGCTGAWASVLQV